MPWGCAVSVPASASAISRPTSGTLWIMILSYRSATVSSGSTASRTWYRMSPVSSPDPSRAPSDRPTSPRFAAPSRAGACPRYAGSSEAWKLAASSRGTPRSSALSRLRVADRQEQVRLESRRIAATNSGVFGLRRLVDWDAAVTRLRRRSSSLRPRCSCWSARRGGTSTTATISHGSVQQRREVAVAERSLAGAEEDDSPCTCSFGSESALNAAARSCSGCSMAIRSMLEPS